MNRFNINNCRICFSSTDLLNVCDISNNGSTYYEELLYVVPEIDWSASNLPSKVCKTCIEQTEAFTEFKIMCIQSSVPRLKYITEKAKEVIANETSGTNQQLLNKDVVLNVVADDTVLLIEDEEPEVIPKCKVKRVRGKSPTRKKQKKPKPLCPISEDLKVVEEANDISLIEPCGLNDFETFEIGNIEVNPSIDKSLSEQLRDIDLHILGSNESLNALKGVSRRNSISSDTQSVDSVSTPTVSKPTSIINPEEFFNNDIDSVKEDTGDANKVHCTMCNIKFSSPEGLKIHNNTFHNSKVEAKPKEPEKGNEEAHIVESVAHNSKIQAKPNEPVSEDEEVNVVDTAAVSENLQEFLSFNVNNECEEGDKSEIHDVNSDEIIIDLVDSDDEDCSPPENMLNVISEVIIPPEEKEEMLGTTSDPILYRTDLGVLVPLNETVINERLINKTNEIENDILSGSSELKMCAVEANEVLFYPDEEMGDYMLATDNVDSENNDVDDDSEKQLFTIDMSVSENIVDEFGTTKGSPSRTLLLRRHRLENIREEMLDNGHVSSDDNSSVKSVIIEESQPIQSNTSSRPGKTTKSYLCDICGQTTSNLPNLIHHKEIHSHKLKFQCKECPKRYKTLNSLKYHVLLAHKEKRFSCNTCGYKCATSTVLKSHIRRHKMDFRYACTLCPKHFIEKHELKKHMRHHTGKERLRCVDCDGYFHDARTFRQHRAKHEMVKRTARENNTVRTDTEKENHQASDAESSSDERLTTADKTKPEKLNSYKCTECNKIFASMYNRQNHTCSVIGRRYNYVLHCKLCSEQLKSVGIVRSHLLVKHGIRKKRDEPIDTYFEYI